MQQQHLPSQCTAWGVPASSGTPTQTCLGCGGMGVTLSNSLLQRIRLVAAAALAPEFSAFLRLHCTAGWEQGNRFVVIPLDNGHIVLIFYAGINRSSASLGVFSSSSWQPARQLRPSITTEWICHQRSLSTSGDEEQLEKRFSADNWAWPHYPLPRFYFPYCNLHRLHRGFLNNNSGS